MVQYVDTVSNTTRGVLRVLRIIRRGIMIRRGEVIRVIRIIRRGEVLRRDRALRSVLPLSSFSSPMLRRGSNKPVQTFPLLQTHQCYPSLIYMYTQCSVLHTILYTHIYSYKYKPVQTLPLLQTHRPPSVLCYQHGPEDENICKSKDK